MFPKSCRTYKLWFREKEETEEVPFSLSGACTLDSVGLCE